MEVARAEKWRGEGCLAGASELCWVDEGFATAVVMVEDGRESGGISTDGLIRERQKAPGASLLLQVGDTARATIGAVTVAGDASDG